MRHKFESIIFYLLQISLPPCCFGFKWKLTSVLLILVLGNKCWYDLTHIFFFISSPLETNVLSWTFRRTLIQKFVTNNNSWEIPVHAQSLLFEFKFELYLKREFRNKKENLQTEFSEKKKVKAHWISNQHPTSAEKLKLS